MKNFNNNYNSKYWQEFKKTVPYLSSYLKSVAIGMILSDATILKSGKYALIKFEQSRDQYFFVHQLFYLFKPYTFSHHINVRWDKHKNTVKSFYFKTFNHQMFFDLYNLFYIDGKKVITQEILDKVDYVAFAYWIMGDGSFKSRDNILVLHTEGFSKEENELISNTLNKKFYLHSYLGKALTFPLWGGEGLIKSKVKDKTYYLIYIPHKDKDFIVKNISPHFLEGFKYKVNYT